MTDLTFAELRLANMTTPHARTPEIKLDELDMLARMDTPTLSRTLAEMVIQADRIALIKNIDLVAAIRERFDPQTQPQEKENNQ